VSSNIDRMHTADAAGAEQTYFQHYDPPKRQLPTAYSGNIATFAPASKRILHSGAKLVLGAVQKTL
jgi:hypothetical protein